MLWSFAFAQPLLDLLGDAPEFFVARDNTRGDIILLAIGVTLVPPLLLTALEGVVAAFSERWRRVLHLALVGALATAFLLQLLEDGPGGSSAVLLPLAAGLGAAAALVYARSRAGPAVLTVLSPAPLVFAGVFLLVSPVSKLVLPGGEVETSRVAIPSDAPVVMIVFDELSGLALTGADGKINAARYPNFASLAEDSTWYRNANTVADSTERAVPALLSGVVPDANAAPIASNYPRSLFTMLGGRYSLKVIERLTDLCPDQLCPGEAGGRLPTRTRLRELASDLSVVSLHLLLPDDLADDLPAVDRSFGDFGGTGGGADPGAATRGLAAVAALSQRTEQFGDFTRQLAGGPQRTRLDFLHVALPHNPYHYLPTGQRYADVLGSPPGLEPGAPAGKWNGNRWLTRQAFQRYLLQVRYSDRLLGEALARLRASGRYDRSLIVVVSDHGASFRPGVPFRDVREANAPAIASVPLLVKAPGQRRGRIDDANVHTTDVLPTIATGLGIRLPWELEGRPAGERRPGGTLVVTPQHGGADVSLAFADFVRRRDALVEEMLAAFGEDPAGLYRGGPDPDLVGKSVPASGASEARFELDAGGQLDAIDPDGAVVPSLLTGTATSMPSGARLAVAVNGRIEAVTVTYERDDVTRFAALVPPSSFVRGTNAVELISVSGAGAGRRFARLRGSQRRYRIVRDGGRTFLVAGSGRRIEVVPGAVEGGVDRLNAGAAEITIAGWAGTTKPARTADEVVAFAGDVFLAAGRPSAPRTDLVKLYGAGLARAGFSLGAARLHSDPENAPVEVYAIVGDRASQLKAPGAP